MGWRASRRAGLGYARSRSLRFRGVAGCLENQMRFHLIFAALLYGLMAVSANAAGLSVEDRAEIEALATGEMAKLVVHGEPRARLDEVFLDEAGEEVSLADLEGRVVLLNLWATWCPPCRAEMPSIDRLAGEMAGPEEGLAVIALSSDRDGAKRIKRFYDAEIGRASGRARAEGGAGALV